jgi:hypothetical protein
LPSDAETPNASPLSNFQCIAVMQRVAMCCSVLQCIAVYCIVVQCFAVCCCVLLYVAVQPIPSNHNSTCKIKRVELYVYTRRYTRTHTRSVTHTHTNTYTHTECHTHTHTHTNNEYHQTANLRYVHSTPCNSAHRDTATDNDIRTHTHTHTCAKQKHITDCEEEEEPATVPAMSVSCDLVGAGPALFKAWKATPTMNEDEKLARALQAQENGGISSGRSLKRSDRRAAKKQRCESTKVC